MLPLDTPLGQNFNPTEHPLVSYRPFALESSAQMAGGASIETKGFQVPHEAPAACSQDLPSRLTRLLLSLFSTTLVVLSFTYTLTHLHLPTSNHLKSTSYDSNLPWDLNLAFCPSCLCFVSTSNSDSPESIFHFFIYLRATLLFSLRYD